MNIMRFLFAASAPLTSEDIFPKRVVSSAPDALLVILACCFVGLVLGVGAVKYYTRRRRQRPHRDHHHRPHRKESGGTSTDATSPAAGSQPGDGKRSRRRRRRRDHRPRNPTLAETGGLPPVRKDPPPGP